MNSIKALIIALVASTATGAAFIPAVSRRASQTTLAFGFLKELGLEKPSWLPDFGGKKDESVGEETAVDVEKDPKEEEAEAPAE
jgi:hypothetical protein